MNTFGVWSLIRRSLLYFRSGSLVGAAGVAVGTAVLAGALLVGDSVTASLRALVVERLGDVDEVVLSERFFATSLAERLLADESARDEVRACTAAIITRGTAANESADHRAAQVDILGLDPANDVLPVPGLAPGKCILNHALAESLGARQGDEVVLRVETVSAVPRSLALGRRDQSLGALRLTVAGVADAPGPLRSFSLYGTQRVPRLAWVNRADLAEAVHQRGRANALLIARAVQEERAGGQGSGVRTGIANPESEIGNPEPKIEAALQRIATLDDYGLALRRVERDGVVSLESQSIFLSPAVVSAADSAAADLGLQPQHVLVYLANTIERLERAPSSETAAPLGLETRREGALSGASRPRPNATGPSGLPTIEATLTSFPAPRSIPYSIVAGLDHLPGREIRDGEIVLNQWAADDLRAETGDRLRLLYAARQPNGDLVETGQSGPETVFRVAAIIPTEGLGADPSLTPEYKGVTDAATMAKWDPPSDFGFQLSRIRPRDEAYWDRWRAAPKAFISLAAAQRLWATPLGRLTAVRLPLDRSAEFEARLRAHLRPRAMGLVLRPIKAEQLAAAGGSTDFGQLFVGFSLFLIVSAALLVALLYRLTIEGRARQIGLMLAAGFRPRRVRRLHVAEGMLLAVLGGAVGLAGAVGYAALMLAGLRSWWIGAVGSPFARLYVSGPTLVTGYAASLLIAYATIRWVVRQIGRVPASVLLAGAFGTARRAQPGTGRLARWMAPTVAALAAACLVLSAVSVLSAAAGFFASGGLAFVAALAAMSAYLRHPSRARPVRFSSAVALERLALRNAGQHATRSLLTMALIGAAAFILVTVAAMRPGPPADPLDIHSGTGGFNLIADADLPLLYDLATDAGRRRLVALPADLRGDVEFVSLRASDGEDISCLNLFRPNRPKVLGVPDSLIEHGGFDFAAAEEAVENPWTLLLPHPGRPATGATGGDVPVIADAQTAEWSLRLRLGEALTITDESGTERRLRLVALLRESVFQGELLMRDADFVRCFPSRAGFNRVLVRAPADQAVQVKAALEQALAPFGITVDRAADRLALFAAVTATYLTTFQTLGGLGLLLGTVGLAVVLLRGLIERRGELALLTALGFRRRAVARLVLAENAFLLAAGLAAGTASALLAVLPQVASRLSGANGLALAATLLGVLGVGLAALVLAVRRGLRLVRVADLRAE
jgi:putative ABC transport system permease protein